MYSLMADQKQAVRWNQFVAPLTLKVSRDLFKYIRSRVKEHVEMSEVVATKQQVPASVLAVTCL